MKNGPILHTLLAASLSFAWMPEVAAQTDSITVSGYVAYHPGCYEMDSARVSITDRKGKPVASTYSDTTGAFFLQAPVHRLNPRHTFISVEKEGYYASWGQLRHKQNQRFYRDFELFSRPYEEVLMLRKAKLELEEQKAAKQSRKKRKKG